MIGIPHYSRRAVRERGVSKVIGDTDERDLTFGRRDR